MLGGLVGHHDAIEGCNLLELVRARGSEPARDRLQPTVHRTFVWKGESACQEFSELVRCTLPSVGTTARRMAVGRPFVPRWALLGNSLEDSFRHEKPFELRCLRSDCFQSPKPTQLFFDLIFDQ